MHAAGLGVSAKQDGSSHMSTRFAMYSERSGTLQVGLTVQTGPQHTCV